MTDEHVDLEESAMSHVEQSKTGVEPAGAHEAKGLVAETREDISQASEALVAAVTTRAQAMAVEAKEVVADAESKAREAAAAAATRMRSMAAELNGALAQAQSSVARAKKAVKAESGAAKARMKKIRRAAVAKVKRGLAGAQEKITKVKKGVGGIQTAVRKKAKSTEATLRKTAAQVRKAFAAKSPKAERRNGSGVAKAARKVERKMKRGLRTPKR
jgi:hypothetical protein